MTTIMKRRPSRGVASLLLLCGLALAGCSSDDSTSTAGAESAEAAGSVDTASSAVAALPSQRGGVRRTSTSSGADQALEPSVIQTGTLTLESDDVAAARFDLGKLLDALDGSVADEKTTADDAGGVRLSRIQVRVPSEEFDAAMTGIGELGEVLQSTRKAQDVTADVIDTEVRIRAQEESLRRIEVLFDRAEDIGDIVSIEGQLSRRQAELDSLKGQLAYLRDQTTMSTITVYLEQREEARPAPTDDDVAFVDGLRGGWRALGGVGAGLATATGALLPFALVLAMVAAPVTLAARRWRVGRPARTTLGEG